MRGAWSGVLLRWAARPGGRWSAGPAARWIGVLVLGSALVAASGIAAAQASVPDPADPYQSFPWLDMQREYLGGAPVRFDKRVEVLGPAFAEDPMNVPISVRVDPALGRVERIVVLVDRNPIRRVLDFQPMLALPALAFRFKLEQASPVRAAVQLAGGAWVVGGTWVDSAGGGCTVSGASRKDGTWSQTLGEVSGRLFSRGADSGARLRVQVMHPMDTGLVGGVPAFYVNRLSVRDRQGRELARLQTYEPLSENPVLSFDFAQPPVGGVQVVGTDNNGNRIASTLP
jgi:sulfur-oxidizing protein SoxY